MKNRSEISAPNIAGLDVIVAALPMGRKSLFERIFRVNAARGILHPPATMNGWIEEHFGSIDMVKNQKLVRVTNIITFEGSSFNGLRSNRPVNQGSKIDLEVELNKDSEPLDAPLANTPEDIFGRIKGKHCITASNIAKYDGFHSLVVFDEHNPLRFTAGEVSDYVDTGLCWATKAHEVDPSAKYYFFMWNCGWKAGASLVHGHAQVMLARDCHYARVEGLRQAALGYEAKFGSNYFDDLYRVHRSIGCGFKKEKVRILAYLSPLKEKEVILMSDKLDMALKKVIYQVLACFRDKMGVNSFDLAIYMPPIAPVEEDWGGFPVVVRIVDRGEIGDRNSDIGAMELYASSVVASDPFRVARFLKKSLNFNGKTLQEIV